jgi:hypothetical protein
MDESEQEEIGPISDWKEQYETIGDFLTRKISELDTLIALYKKTPNVDKHDLGWMNYVSGILEYLKDDLDITDNDQKRLLEHERKIKTIRKDLHTNTSTTATALTAINEFIEHYKPMLEELESERQFRDNIGGAKRN